jgi:aryl carrier-like protein
MSAIILDRRLEPVPIGVIGDLYIGGIGVGRGYLNDPSRTADAFIPDRFSDCPGARLYRTGDRGRRRADGNLDFLGRVDHMIKIRGFRIEPGEIEAALVLHPEVDEAVVVAREHPSGERVLVGFFVSSASPAPTGALLRAFLATHLPPYMVPTLLSAIPAVPLTAHGKVDARGLPSPAWEDQHAREHVPARTRSEAMLARIWADVLQLDRVGISDDFFAIGGDSIRSIQIVARCKRAGLELRPTDLFLHPTIASLAAHADRQSAVRDAPALATLDVSADHLARALAQVQFEAD